MGHAVSPSRITDHAAPRRAALIMCCLAVGSLLFARPDGANRPMMTAGPRPLRRATRHAAFLRDSIRGAGRPQDDTRQAVRTGARHT